MLPTYAELLRRREAPAGSAWGLFGSDDRVGTLNLAGPEQIARAARLVERGAVFSLNWELTKPDPPLFALRKPVRHTVLALPRGYDDHYDDFYPQVSSQWDSLVHIKHEQHGHYNIGTDRGAGWPSIEHWARRGIAGRFLLADLEAYRRDAGAPIDPMESDALTVEDLDGALARQRSTIDPGDILLLNVGWIRRYEQLSVEARHEIASRPPQWVGIASGEQMAAWLWDHRISAVASDAPTLEVFPVRGDDFLHRRLIPMLGMAIGELFRLDHLADDCASDGRYTGLLTAAPLNMPGGVGSPANALALK